MPAQGIFDDSLLTLRAFEQEYTGKVKSIYIDPPYDTGNAFEYYEDGLECTIWLSLTENRLELLHCFLANDESIWISIGDDQAYLKVSYDGRNFVNNVILQKKYSPQNDIKHCQLYFEKIFVYISCK
ncbi:DNA methyltransferase [Bartonella sp. B39]